MLHCLSDPRIFCILSDEWEDRGHVKTVRSKQLVLEFLLEREFIGSKGLLVTWGKLKPKDNCQ